MFSRSRFSFTMLAVTTLLSVSVPVYAEDVAVEEPKKVVNDPQETMRLLDLFGDVFEKVRDSYVEEPEDKMLVESAINGMLTALDPHSSYLDFEAFKEMQVQTKGEFGGLGIEVTLKNGMVYVVSPIDDTPAYKAGVQAGDYISHIDGESVIGMTLKDAVEKMRGKPKTDITLTILRESEEQPKDITITRDIIHIKSVRSRVEKDDIVYLRVTSFAEQTTEELKKAWEEQNKKIGKDKVKGVVLDLRNNPGGLLDQAIGVSDMFLEHGEIVSTRGREADETHRFNATEGDDTNGLPVVVLINGGSASASEIVSGALQDHGRAIIMGTKSFGKGSVQTIIPLPKDSAIRLTTSRYYTPSGRSIQAKGIEPDIIIEPAKVEYLNTASALNTTEASLRGHLENNDKSDDAEAKEKLEKLRESADAKKGTAKEKEAENKTEKPDENASQYDTDFQLARAVDLLHGLSVYLQAQDPKAQASR